MDTKIFSYQWLYPPFYAGIFVSSVNRIREKERNIDLGFFTKELSEKYGLPQLPFSIVVPEGYSYQFNHKTPVIHLDVLTNYIEKYIDEAPFKINSKGGTGLSAGRVSNIKLFKSTILRYEIEELNSQKILIKNKVFSYFI